MNEHQHDTTTQADELHALRHSASHVMAQAVRRLYPQVKLAIGPPIADGFYYDLELPFQLTDEDLPKIEAEMRKIIAENYPFVRSMRAKTEALRWAQARGEPYKTEIIQGLDVEQVSFYTDGDFEDLCEGPHVKSTGEIKAAKLLNLAGAYWRGDEHNAQLQRIYGTAWFSEGELEAHLKRLEEAKLRDHRKLAKELGYVQFIEEAGPGLAFYPPAGGLVRYLIEEYVRQEHLKRGYQFVMGPPIMRADIWQTSGHYDYYKDNMFIFKTEGQEYAIKPMNCPGHILLYQSKTRSYRDLPLRFFELGNVCRNEKSGVLHGLLRVRAFTQDDAHIFCTPEQLVDEISHILPFALEMLHVFGFNEFDIELSTKPAKAIGSAQQWEQAEDALRNAMQRINLPFQVHEGEGAFYGPKIDIQLKDVLGRRWQCSTVQCDFALPERFHLEYIGEDGKGHRPIMLHRAILGSFERFLGALLEHYAGALPVWLSPVQARIIPISGKVSEYAQTVQRSLAARSIRAAIDDTNQTMQAKIRDAQLAKIPYMLVVGLREQANNSVAVRSRAKGDEGPVSLREFIDRLSREVAEKK